MLCKLSLAYFILIVKLTAKKMVDSVEEDWWIKDDRPPVGENIPNQQERSVKQKIKQTATVLTNTPIISARSTIVNESGNVKRKPSIRKKASLEKHKTSKILTKDSCLRSTGKEKKYAPEKRIIVAGPDNKSSQKHRGIRKRKRDSNRKDSHVELLTIINNYVKCSLTQVEREAVKELQESDVIVGALESETAGNDYDNAVGSFLYNLTNDTVCKTTSGSGTPPVIIVAASALRCIYLRKILCAALSRRRSRGASGGGVAKLFAKHVKLSEQIKFLESHRELVAGVGTPQRILALFHEGALSVADLKYLVFDWYHEDVKKRTLINMKELKSSVLLLLTNYALNAQKAPSQTECCKIVLL